MAIKNGYRQLSDLFKALAHPIRVQILELVAQDESCVCHLAHLLHRPQPYISQQLAVLRKAGLVVDRREGLLVFYRPAREEVQALMALGRLAMGQGAQPQPPFSPPNQTDPSCPCPKCRGREREGICT